MTGLLIFITVWLGWLSNNASSLLPVKNKSEYRAAKYSMEIDFSKDADRVQMPELEYMMSDLATVSYKYFIQYGNDTFIEIIDPGNGVKPF